MPNTGHGMDANRVRRVAPALRTALTLSGFMGAMPARLKAFLLHLAASALVALLALLLVFKLWYPAPLHAALGVTHILLLLLLIDVVLGPLLTLLIYKVGKKTLVMDLTIIAALQLAALGYGLWTVAEGRPDWIVYNVDRFDVVTAVDIDTRQLDEARTQYRNAPPRTGPQWVGALKPYDPEQSNNILFEAVQGGSDIAQRPNLYLQKPCDSARNRWENSTTSTMPPQFATPCRAGQALPPGYR